ncbi:MAG: hypothetical protein KDA61_08735 [Planctomycetales bacterium]|nr:hypothetical protein [Planctomycetales bacterium]
MSRLAIIDWDSRELRLAVADLARRGACRVHCQTLNWDDAERKGLEAGSFEAVVELLAERLPRGCQGVLFAQRSHLESLTLSLPPATDAELPALVENHLAVESVASDAEASYDVLSLDNDPESPRKVLATTMDRALAERYRGLAAQLKLTRPRLCVRAAATPVVFESTNDPSGPPRLYVVPNVEDVDMTVVANGVRYWRSVYCSPTGESEAFFDFLSDEVVRTLAVAADALPEEAPPASIVAVLGAHEAPSLVAELQRRLDTDVERREPRLVDAEVEFEGDGDLPGRFAPLLGVLTQLQRGERPHVDLLNPVVHKAPASPKRTWVLAGVATAVALAIAAFTLHEEVAERQAESELLARQLKTQRDELKKAAPYSTAWSAIQRWDQSHVVWLDELRDLALRFPQPGKAVALDFSASRSSSGAATVRLSGKATDPTVVASLDRALRDDYREALSRNLREQAVASDDPLAWRFESLINVRPRPAKAYREAFDAGIASEEALP